MNILSWVLALSFMVGALYESLKFYQASLCRQLAWLKSTESLTRSLILGAQPQETIHTLGCQLTIKRLHRVVKWSAVPQNKWHSFEAKLKGSL
jgi:hypothetical protein